MSAVPPHNPTAALNEVLSEVIDGVLEVKQAHRTVASQHTLHSELDQLLEDLRAWARILVEEDEVLGVSPLAFMPSVAGRQPPNLWPSGGTDDDVRRVVGAHLDRLGQHVAAALAEQEEETSRTALAEVARGLQAHRQALNDP